MVWCSHCHNLTLQHFHHSKRNLVGSFPSSPPSHGIVQYKIFCACHSFFKVHPCCSMDVLGLHFFLLPNSIPLYGYTTSCLSNHQMMDTWDVSFHLLTMVNNPAIFLKSRCIPYQAKDCIRRAGTSTFPKKVQKLKVPLR